MEVAYVQYSKITNLEIQARWFLLDGNKTEQKASFRSHLSLRQNNAASFSCHTPSMSLWTDSESDEVLVPDWQLS